MKNATEVAFAPLSTAVFQGINKGLIAVMSYLTPLINTLGKDLPGVLSRIGQIAGPYIKIIGDEFKLVLPVVKLLFDGLGVIVDLLTGKWGAAWAGVQAMFRAVGDVITSFGHLVEDMLLAPFRALGIDLPKALDSFWNTITAIPGEVFNDLVTLGAQVWSAISGGFGQAIGAAEAGIAGLWGWVTGIAGEVFNDLANLGGQVWNAISGGFGQAVGAAEAGISALWGWATGIAGRVGGQLANIGGAVWNALSAGLGQAVGGASAGIGGLYSWAGGISQNLINAMGSIGTDMYNAGKAIIGKLADGITAGLGDVTNAVKGVLSSARNLLPFSPAKEGPLSGSGWTALYTSGSKITGQIAAGVASGSLGLEALLTPPTTGAIGTNGSGLGPAAYGGPTIVIQEANFNDAADMETFMRQAAWVIKTQGI